MRRLHLVGPQVDPLMALCDMAGTCGDWELAESSARSLDRLASGNGEIAARPFADAALAHVALARGDPAGAASHVGHGLDVMRRSRTFVALNDVLFAGARVLSTADRVDDASAMWHARAARRRRQGVVDPAPVTRLAHHEQLSPEQSPGPGNAPPGAPTDRELVDWARHRLRATPARGQH